MTLEELQTTLRDAGAAVQANLDWCNRVRANWGLTPVARRTTPHTDAQADAERLRYIAQWGLDKTDFDGGVTIEQFRILIDEDRELWREGREPDSGGGRTTTDAGEPIDADCQRCRGGGCEWCADTGKGIRGDTGNEEADHILDRLMSDDPDFDDCVAAATFIRRLVIDNKGPDGYATWKDAALAERIKNRADAGERADGWRPIETAPKDGKPILATNGKTYLIVEWSDWGNGHWVDQSNEDWPLSGIGFKATHWMPLPAAPAIDAERASGGAAE